MTALAFEEQTVKAMIDRLRGMDNAYAAAARTEHAAKLRQIRHSMTQLKPAKDQAEKLQAALVTCEDKRQKNSENDSGCYRMFIGSFQGA